MVRGFTHIPFSIPPAACSRWETGAAPLVTQSCISGEIHRPRQPRPLLGSHAMRGAFFAGSAFAHPLIPFFTSPAACSLWETEEAPHVAHS